MKKEIIIGALLLVIGFVIGLLCRPNHVREVTKKVTDTLVVRDTHIIEKPVLVERTIKDSLLVEVRDTIRIRDSVFVALPMEKKTYKGDEYYAEVSGYKPSLDRIEVYPKNTTITEKVTLDRERNSLGIGIETRYMNGLTTPIYLEYERMLHKNVSFYGQVLYDLPSQTYGAGVGLKMSIGW